MRAPQTPKLQRPPATPRFNLVKPNYSARTPIVNDNHFSDTPLQTPGLGAPSDSFNPGASSVPLPNGPPKYVQPAGKRPMSKGLTNKRITGNI